MPRDVTCRELIEFLMDYLDGALSTDERESFEAHLGICPDCVNYIAEYRSTVRAGRAAFTDPEAAPPDDVPEDLIAAILETRRSG